MYVEANQLLKGKQIETGEYNRQILELYFLYLQYETTIRSAALQMDR